MRYGGRESPSGSVYSQTGEKGREELGGENKRRGVLIAAIVGGVALAIALGVGLGVGLGKKQGVATVQVMDNVGNLNSGVGGTTSGTPTAIEVISTTSTSSSSVDPSLSTSALSLVPTSIDAVATSISTRKSIPIDTWIFPASDTPTDSLESPSATPWTGDLFPSSALVVSPDPLATPSPSPSDFSSDAPLPTVDTTFPASIAPEPSPQSSTDSNGGTYVYTTRPIVRPLLPFVGFY